MKGNLQLFMTYRPCITPLEIRMENGSLFNVVGIDTIRFSNSFILTSVFYVLNLHCNLLFVSKLIDDLQCTTSFSSSLVVFPNLASGRKIDSAEMNARLYLLKFPVSSLYVFGHRYLHSYSSPSFPYSSINGLSNDNKESTIMLWHYHLGHSNFAYLERALPSLFVNKSYTIFHCDVCHLPKHTRSTCSPVFYKKSFPFSLIHSDIWGSSWIPNISGSRWFLLFVDDQTRLSWVFLMKEKSQTVSLFKKVHAMVQNQFHTNIKVLKTDNAKDYFNSILGDYFSSLDIVHQSSCNDILQKNGVAE